MSVRELQGEPGTWAVASRPGNDVTIDVRDLRMRYGTVDVLHGVNFQAHQGEVVALLGPNGAGKTTTIEILEGFRMRSAGEVHVLGTDPAKGDEAWRARLGVVLQSWRDHGKWRVRTLLASLAQSYVPYRRPYDVDELLQLVGLTEQSNANIAKLSGGQRRRLDVAIGIVGKPDLLFLDEPTAGFDPQARREFHELVHRLSDLNNTTVLLTTHDLDEAEKLADQVLILAGGRIVANGTVAELTARLTKQTQVGWERHGQRYVHTTSDVAKFVRELFAQYGEEITDLEVHKGSLEDTYIAMVQQHEAGYAERTAERTAERFRAAEGNPR